MRIHEENSRQYAETLIKALNTDPASLENWRCIYIEKNETLSRDWYKERLNQIKTANRTLDCEVLFCEDNDIFIISNSMDGEAMYMLAHETVTPGRSNQNYHSIMLYDLFRDWRIMREIMLKKTTADSAAFRITAKHKEPAHNFGEVQNFMEVFNQSLENRKTRGDLQIMLVEDDPLTRRIVTSNLKKRYSLITAANAHEAVANYMMHAPDIVFLDIGLPDVSGFEVLNQIMTSDPKAYVVMFSSNSYLDNVTTALENGASGFIAKPFRHEKIHQYINDGAMHHRKSVI